jgi:hypothetical protein
MSTPPSQLCLENLPSSGSEERKYHLWMMDHKTLKQRAIRIPNELRRLFFTPTKQSYSKQVEKIEMWKKMGKGEEALASIASLVTLLWTLNGRN